jgi:hypothetical protein
MKPLLMVDDDGRSALHRLVDQLGKDTEIVCREFGTINAVCKRMGWRTLHQFEPELCGALKACVKGDDPVMIYLADNVYPPQLLDVPLTPDTACVAEFPIAGLAHWSSRGWHRDNEYDKSCRALISPWCLSAKTLREARGDQAHVIFQDASVRPFFVESRGWHDIGTPEGFSDLWRSDPQADWMATLASLRSPDPSPRIPEGR